MGDSAEFEKLSALESRLASALDRIAKGVAARSAAEAPASGGVAGAVLAQAIARADEAEAARQAVEARASKLSTRVETLEARLAEAQDALEAFGSAPEEGPGDAARITELEAELAGAVAARAELETRIAELEGAAEGADGAGARSDELEQEVNILKRRVERARQERDAALEARDAAQDVADELTGASGAEPDDRILSLRAETRRLQGVVEELSRGIEDLRAGAAGETADGVLEAQVAALNEVRRAEAAELGRILADLGAVDAADAPLGEEGAGHA